MHTHTCINVCACALCCSCCIICDALLTQVPNVYAGTDVNFRDESNKTALHHATLQKDLTLVSLLVQFKCDMDAEDGSGKTALFYAVTQDDDILVGYFLSRGAKLDYWEEIEEKEGGGGGGSRRKMSVQDIAQGAMKLLLEELLSAKNENSE